MCEAWKEKKNTWGFEYRAKAKEWEIVFSSYGFADWVGVNFCPFCGSKLDGDGCTGDWRVNKWSREEDK